MIQALIPRLLLIDYLNATLLLPLPFSCLSYDLFPDGRLREVILLRDDPHSFLRRFSFLIENHLDCTRLKLVDRDTMLTHIHFALGPRSD